MGSCDIGLIGLAVMGENLVINMANHGFPVAVFNRTLSKVDGFLESRAKDKNVRGCHSLDELVKSVKRPRPIMLMVKAGKPVDELISALSPLLAKGDILIDGGNSHFQDTIRRFSRLKKKGLHYVGMGVSGGEEGALLGPAIMPGGSAEAWPQLQPIFQAIAAKADDGLPCCDWLGADGAGHFVKMIHNGIEYADMQIIAEAYWLMDKLVGLSADEMQKVFGEWNQGELNSYLIEITAVIMAQKDPGTQQPLIQLIQDSAGQKGTGKWTSETALDLGVAAPTIAEAVFSRALSAIKAERTTAAKALKGPLLNLEGSKIQFVEMIRKALYASKICSYAQGFQLLRAASAANHWDFNFGKIAMIWRAGCIIRARFLGKIKEAFDRRPDLANLLLDPYFQSAIESSQDAWRKVVAKAIECGLPVPAFSSALAYYDGYRSEQLPANLLQAQRDYFGAHTYERNDRAPGEFFHTEWGKKP